MRVTIIPVDHLIIVDGEALRFDFPAPADMHALQWYGDKGHIEGVSGSFYRDLKAEDYATEVAPFVTLWQAEKAHLAAEAEAAEAARSAEYNSVAARFERLRAERDARLTATDYYVMPDYPADATMLVAVQNYREALRDLPNQAGAPWTDDTIPWPQNPLRI